MKTKLANPRADKNRHFFSSAFRALQMTIHDTGDKLHVNCDAYSHPSCTALIPKCGMTWQTDQHTLKSCATESVHALNCFQFLPRK